MNRNSDAVTAILGQCQGQDLDPHYLGFFECFNQQLFFEAHEVLEYLWLPQRKGPNGPFYKGLIQLAGAFVHLQKQRPGPATALFKLAASNLEKYPIIHERLHVPQVLAIITDWRQRTETPGQSLSVADAPALQLEAAVDPSDY